MHLKEGEDPVGAFVWRQSDSSLIHVLGGEQDSIFDAFARVKELIETDSYFNPKYYCAKTSKELYREEECKMDLEVLKMTYYRRSSNMSIDSENSDARDSAYEPELHVPITCGRKSSTIRFAHGPPIDLTLEGQKHYSKNKEGKSILKTSSARFHVTVSPPSMTSSRPRSLSCTLKYESNNDDHKKRGKKVVMMDINGKSMENRRLNPVKTPHPRRGSNEDRECRTETDFPFCDLEFKKNRIYDEEIDFNCEDEDSSDSNDSLSSNGSRPSEEVTAISPIILPKETSLEPVSRMSEIDVNHWGNCRHNRKEMSQYLRKSARSSELPRHQWVKNAFDFDTDPHELAKQNSHRNMEATSLHKFVQKKEPSTGVKYSLEPMF